jgi:hypothetical protein
MVKLANIAAPLYEWYDKPNFTCVSGLSFTLQTIRA